MLYEQLMFAAAIEKSPFGLYRVNKIPELNRVLSQTNSVYAITVSLFTIPLNIIPTYIHNKICGILIRAELHRCLLRQERSHTHERSGRSGFHCGSIHVHAFVFIHKALLYTYCVDVCYVCISVKSAFVRTTKSTI